MRCPHTHPRSITTGDWLACLFFPVSPHPLSSCVRLWGQTKVYVSEVSIPQQARRPRPPRRCRRPDVQLRTRRTVRRRLNPTQPNPKQSTCLGCDTDFPHFAHRHQHRKPAALLLCGIDSDGQRRSGCAGGAAAAATGAWRRRRSWIRLTPMHACMHANVALCARVTTRPYTSGGERCSPPPHSIPHLVFFWGGLAD